MRKITLFLTFLFAVAMATTAQIKTDGTEYRIKEKNTGLYLNVGGASANNYGEVYGSEKKEGDEALVQIFTFVSAPNDGTYDGFYLKSNSGEYISYNGSGQGWNVNNAPEEANAHFLIFEETSAELNEYKIKCYNQSKSNYKYFKWEYVGASGKYHPFNDSDAGAVFVLEEVGLPEYTVTYNYIYNDNVKKTVTHQVVEGVAFPGYDLNLYAASYSGELPTGTVSEGGEYNIVVEFGEMPFEYFEDAAAVVANNGWYNLIMHSNENNIARYRTYLGAGDGTKLAWGEHKSLTNATDEYYWGFVGNPFDGFKVINKAKENCYLTSNGSSNPTMVENGNTTWNINYRKYNPNTDGDYVQLGDWFCLQHPENGKYMNGNANDGIVNFWTDNDNGSAILAVKPITIKATADYATYFAETAIQIPNESGVEVYYANSVADNSVNLEQITGVVYPGTGVVVKCEVDDDLTYAPEVVSLGNDVTVLSGNLLKGTTKRTLITKETGKECYALGMSEGVGFYRAVNGENEGEFYNGAFKAYLEVETAGQSAVVFYSFDFGGNTTAIESVVTPTFDANAPIYDLSGRRVVNAVKGGLYIQNGKKFIVK